MRGKRLTKAEKRVAGILAWRRIGVLVCLAFVWIVLMWLLWCIPIARSEGVSARTSYGVLQWQEGKGSPGQAGTAGRVLPLGIAGSSRIRPVAVAFTVLISVAGTAFIVVYARRSLRNLTPRWRCQNCGHVVSDGFPQSTVCSECGELPNLQKDPWAFWT